MSCARPNLAWGRGSRENHYGGGVNTSMGARQGGLAPTPVVEMDLDRVAHGGFVVGRHENKVVFVTGGLPGERARVEITESTRRFDRGRVVEVVEAAPGRVIPPCPIANKCGGCDWQHASPELQLDLKTAVVAEQLARLGGYEWTGRVQAVEPLLGWRTRMRYAVDARSGAVGMRARRSHDVVSLPAQGCLIAAPGPTRGQLEAAAEGAREVAVVVGDDSTTLVADGERVAGPPTVQQSVAGRRYMVSVRGFWQVHPHAAEILTRAVIDGVRPKQGERALDLYCGTGLFAGALSDAGCRVVGVELSREAVAQARHNVPQAEFLAGPLERMLGRLREPVDLVVLDPTRRGAGSQVVGHVADLGPRAVAYVACDPAALGRDVGFFAEKGYEVTSLEAYDLFPMTHHVECVAILRPLRRTALRPLD